MKEFCCLLIAVLLVACGTDVPLEVEEVASAAMTKHAEPPVLSDYDQLEEHVGKIVTLRGEVFNSKIATIIGVDVRSNDPDLRGQMAEATGLLQKNVVTEEELIGANYANRGPGIFFRLKDLDSNYEASVRPIAQSGQQPVQE